MLHPTFRNIRLRYICKLMGQLTMVSIKIPRSFICVFPETKWCHQHRLCVSVSHCTTQRMLHADTCLYVLITDVYFYPTLASSRPPMALPPVCLPRATPAQVTRGGMTGAPHIHQTAKSSRREQTELNLGDYYSVEADCSKLCEDSIYICSKLVGYFLVELFLCLV